MRTGRHIVRKFTIEEISAIDKPAQAHALAVLMKRATERETKMTDRPVSFDSLEDAMQHLRDVQGLSKSDAMTRARIENPKLYEKYLGAGSGNANYYKVLERYTLNELPPGSDEFMGAVQHIMSRDNCPRTVAMQRARVEEPALFEAYQRQ